MLAHGLCDSLCLADINEEAVEACRRTIQENGLADRVSVYHSDNLTAIPASERWDLVVGNPPFYVDKQEYEIRAYDKDWHIHRGFYADVGRFLKPGGVILMQEANDGSTIDTFRPMIEKNGFSIVLEHGSQPGEKSIISRVPAAVPSLFQSFLPGPRSVK